MRDFLKRLPKAELHLHIEGTLEPELMMALAERNGVSLPYASEDEVRAAYDFEDLQSFLDLYYQGMSVLRTERDFHDLAMDYFQRAHAEGVVHVELHVDPQAHLARGVCLETVMEGLGQARRRAERELDMSTALIMAFLRDRPAEEAMRLLERAEPYWEILDAVGLDSAELGHPPAKFAEVFQRARALGLPRVAHAGEEGPPEYIREALDVLDVCRVDHGVRCLEDPELVARLREQGTVLTVCPLSNLRLKVVERLDDHPLPELLKSGLNLTLNSDDPAYFGGGMLENFEACQRAFDWSRGTFIDLARNAIDAAFMSETRRTELLERLKTCG
ncbi:adenosine deaminase [Halomonas elongata]|uniref:Adenine deaminase n=1 Tax=Halomonas elongata (strain ATCC 33173 / DSM 2581 / NBRC 15536 / NCIMB 2198 / 1H9) TaxID=768066 RepID=E1VCI9_HALED|nr:adenosine deaminase [Halomonas elongata]MDL4862479.1 adenosine deaminase [Halomonas elongata]RAW08916.1 adenosine deaminase [Halomonas elongata]WBF19627.1 adenosine deaminase [Halomonas elongata]WPU48492.1 adenosine deaminase [Halomonas elongata DSM 2581]CBV42344.1 adenine deaminase [Halomonas elongata DSM 2581]